MTLDDWKNLALIIKKTYSPMPHIILWGGEPLVCPFFDELVHYLKSLGFTLGMVTNGVLLDKHIDICTSSFKRIYVSVDGPKSIHDSIRGDGVFDRVSRNIKMLSKSDVFITVMSVLSPKLVENLDGFPEIIEKLGADELYLQNYIRLSKDEAEEYKKWMKEDFGIKATEIDSWVTSLPDDYEERLKLGIEKINKKKYNMSVRYLLHNIEKPCCSPNKHIHISWNGNMLYCTEFYDFFAGNVKKENIDDIFCNELSEKFRNGISKNPACKHCSWRNNENFYL